MDAAALKAEIAKPDYAGLKDDEIAAALNAKTMAVTLPIPAAEVKKQFIKTGVLAKAKFYAADPAADLALRLACQTVYDSLIYDAFTDLDPTDAEQGPLIKSFLDALQAAQCLDDAGRTAVLALAAVELPGSEAFIGRPLDSSDIANARAAP